MPLSSWLKTVINAGVECSVRQIGLSGRSLLDRHEWSPFGRPATVLSLYHVSDDRTCRLYKQYPLIRGHGGYCLRRTWADDRLRYTHDPLKRGSVRWLPIWRPLKTLPPKVEKPASGSGTKLHHHVNFHADRREIGLSVPRQKIHIFLIADSRGGYRPMLHFRKLSSSWF